MQIISRSTFGQTTTALKNPTTTSKGLIDMAPFDDVRFTPNVACPVEIDFIVGSLWFATTDNAPSPIGTTFGALIQLLLGPQVIAVGQYQVQGWATRIPAALQFVTKSVPAGQESKVKVQWQVSPAVSPANAQIGVEYASLRIRVHDNPVTDIPL